MLGPLLPGALDPWGPGALGAGVGLAGAPAWFDLPPVVGVVPVGPVVGEPLLLLPPCRGAMPAAGAGAEVGTDDGGGGGGGGAGRRPVGAADPDPDGGRGAPMIGPRAFPSA